MSSLLVFCRAVLVNTFVRTLSSVCHHPMPFVRGSYYFKSSFRATLFFWPESTAKHSAAERQTHITAVIVDLNAPQKKIMKIFKNILHNTGCPLRGVVTTKTAARRLNTERKTYRSVKARLHMRFLMRFRVQNSPYPTLHECLFREAWRGLERKLWHMFWRHPSFQFLLPWRYFVAAIRD